MDRNYSNQFTTTRTGGVCQMSPKSERSEGTKDDLSEGGGEREREFAGAYFSEA